MFGETVIVKEFGGNPVLCKVWDVTATKVFVCTEATFERLKTIKDHKFPENCFPIGFPKSDVFTFDENSFKQLMVNFQNNPNVWQNMKPYEK